MPSSCVSLPVSIEVCNPHWSSPIEKLRLLEYEGHMTIQTESLDADCENLIEANEACQAQLSQARATVSHLRKELRECRYERGQELQPSAAGFSIAAALIIAMIVRWLK